MCANLNVFMSSEEFFYPHRRLLSRLEHPMCILRRNYIKQFVYDS